MKDTDEGKAQGTERRSRLDWRLADLVERVEPVYETIDNAVKKVREDTRTYRIVQVSPPAGGLHPKNDEQLFARTRFQFRDDDGQSGGYHFGSEFLKQTEESTYRTRNITVLEEMGPEDAELEAYSFPADWTPPSIPGEARDYWAMLDAVIKTLARNAGEFMGYPERERRTAKITLAEWTRGIHDTEAGRKVLADAENQVRINHVAPSLESLWAWYDDPTT